MNITVLRKDGINNNGGSSNGCTASYNNCSGSGRETNELWVNNGKLYLSYCVHDLNLFLVVNFRQD